MDWRLLSGSLSQGLTKRPGPWASLLSNASLIIHVQDKEWRGRKQVCVLPWNNEKISIQNVIKPTIKN